VLAVSAELIPLAEPACGDTLEGVHQRSDGHLRRVLDQQMDVIVLAVVCLDYGVRVMARYRFRLYPGPAQEQMLARTFGCARVVFNDCLRLRDDLHAAGKKVSDTEVQRRVITVAKTICCMCGMKDGPKPLEVREWACGTCGSVRDRGINAARNILLEGRKVAAGQADTQNDCGADVRPGRAPAAGAEAVAHPSAA
jgi:transposase